LLRAGEPLGDEHDRAAALPVGADRPPATAAAADLDVPGHDVTVPRAADTATAPRRTWFTPQELLVHMVETDSSQVRALRAPRAPWGASPFPGSAGEHAPRTGPRRAPPAR